MFYHKEIVKSEIKKHSLLFWKKELESDIKIASSFAPQTSENSLTFHIDGIFIFSIAQFNSNCGLMNLYHYRCYNKKFEPYAISLLLMMVATCGKSSIVYHKDIVDIKNPEKYGFQVSKISPLVTLNLIDILDIKTKTNFLSNLVFKLDCFYKERNNVYPYFYKKIKNKKYKTNYKIQ
jgi:hypothetical protein